MSRPPTVVHAIDDLSAAASVLDAYPSYKVALRDRFRGALLGLALVPVALQADASVQRRAAFAQLMQAAPGLLRYHNCWRQRWQWIEAIAPKAPARATALIVAGDWLEAFILEAFITDRPILSTVSVSTPPSVNCLQASLNRYGFSERQRQCYQHLSLQLHRLMRQTNAHADCLPTSYLLSMQTAIADDNAINSKNDATERESMLIMPAIIGFLSGAAGGLSALPVLWQMEMGSESRMATLSAADQIYADWAGVLN